MVESIFSFISQTLEKCDKKKNIKLDVFDDTIPMMTNLD